MLKQGSIVDVRSQTLTKADGYLVAGMCYYPRGVYHDYPRFLARFR